MKRSRFCKFCFKTILLLSAVILSVALFEGFLWLFFPVPIQRGIHVELEQNLPGLASRIVYDRNPMGLRSIRMKTQQKPPDTLRVLCLGASTTDQPTQSTPDTWSGVLENMLNDYFSEKGVTVEVGAYGRGGDKILHRFIWASDNIHSLEPDIVVLLEGINDLCFNGGPGYMYPGFRMQLARYGRAGEMRDRMFVENYLGQDMSSYMTIRRYSQFARHVTNLLRLRAVRKASRAGMIKEWHSAAMPSLHIEYMEYPFVEKPMRNPDPIREFGDGLAAITSALSSEDIPALVLSQPALWKPDMTDEELGRLWFWVETPQGRVRPSTAWLSSELDRYNVLQKTVALQNNARFFDLANVAPQTLDMFFDDCHFTDSANRHVAEQIFPVVSEMLMSVLKNNAGAELYNPDDGVQQR